MDIRFVCVCFQELQQEACDWVLSKTWIYRDFVIMFKLLMITSCLFTACGMVLYSCYKEGIKVGVWETNGRKQMYKFGQASVFR